MAKKFSPNETIVHVLINRGVSQPEDIAFKFSDDPRAAGESLSYGELLAEATNLSMQLPTVHGERILLVLRSNRYFVVAFFACLLVGAVPVPTVHRRNNLRARLQALISDAQPLLGITDLDEVAQLGRELECCCIPWLNLAKLPPIGKSLADPIHQCRHVTPESLAFLQYTSGSTGQPKGVMITHRNIMANSAAICQAFNHNRMSIGLIPLPLFHDMGLIGGVMQPLYAGFPVEILNPILAVQKPADWLRRISISRVTTSGGPNFLFELACKLVSDDDLIQLDLSSWKIAFCGAEPVRRSTVEAFIKRFGPVGFRRQAFFPCYGLAEATLYVTGAALDTTDLTLDLDLETPVPCGIPGLDITVRIVDLQTGLEAPEGVEGEIWVTGPGVAKGYWNSPVQSQVVFGAEISDSSDGPFVRTGDLGHILGNKLYVTGRLKDLIIVRGRNFAPQDLECSAEQSHPSLVMSGSAAFCIHGRDKDSLVIVAEVNRQTLRRPEDWPAIEAAVRSAITVAFQLKVDDVVLLRPGNLPRTSSGKVRRNQCRTDYLAQTLVRVSAESVPETG